MNHTWLSDYIIYSEREGQGYARRACRPLESHIKKLLGLPVSEQSVHAEIKYLKLVAGGVTCECPACKLRAPGSAGIFWAVMWKMQRKTSLKPLRLDQSSIPTALPLASDQADAF